MAAHRYWRAIGVEAYGVAGLDITEFQLLAGSARVDAPATLASNIAPATGSLTNLKDDDTSTGATWGAEDLKTLVLSWDFGAGGDKDVSDVRIGSSTDAKKFLLIVRLQWSDDATAWTDAYTYAGIAWPGTRTKTSSLALQSAQLAALAPTAYFKLDELSGTAYTDDSGNGRTATASGTVTQGGPGLISDSANSITIGTGGAITVPDPFGSNYAGPVSVRVVFNGPAGGFPMAARGRDGFGEGWSLNLSVQANGSLLFGGIIGSTQFLAVSAAGVYTAGTVAEAVGVFTPGLLSCYLNGALVGAISTGGGPLRNSTVGLTMGQANGVSGVGVQLDEVAWWGVALTAAQIRALADAGKVSRNLVRGRAAIQPPISIPSAASIVLPYGAVNARPFNIRGRGDYLTGVLGQGIGRVRGFTLDYVNPLNKPYPCRVRLVREADGLVIRDLWSGADGSYDFQYIDELQSYTVVAYYLAHGKRAVITDGLTLANGKVELMP